MTIKSEITIEEALILAKKNKHVMKPLAPQGELQRYHCKKSGCKGLLFADTAHSLVFGSAISHTCQDYKTINMEHGVSTRTPHAKLKKSKNDYSYLPDSSWSYDSGINKKICTKCSEPLYRVFKINRGKRYVGLFCEKCKSIYNISLNSMCSTRLVCDEKNVTLGAPTCG